jgi:hypothetical protein
LHSSQIYIFVFVSFFNAVLFLNCKCTHCLLLVFYITNSSQLIVGCHHIEISLFLFQIHLTWILRWVWIKVFMIFNLEIFEGKFVGFINHWDCFLLCPVHEVFSPLWRLCFQNHHHQMDFLSIMIQFPFCFASILSYPQFILIHFTF